MGEFNTDKGNQKVGLCAVEIYPNGYDIDNDNGTMRLNTDGTREFIPSLDHRMGGTAPAQKTDIGSNVFDALGIEKSLENAERSTRRIVTNDNAIGSIRPKSLLQQLGEKIGVRRSSPSVSNTGSIGRSTGLVKGNWFPTFRLKSSTINIVLKGVKGVSFGLGMFGIATAIHDCVTGRENWLGRGGAHVLLSIGAMANPWIGLGALGYDLFLKDKFVKKF